MAGPLFTANRAIVSAQGARLQLTAAHLAQEGIEHVRAMRDNEYLAKYEAALTDNAIVASTAGWEAFVALVSPCSVSEVCTLDPFLPMGVAANDSASLKICSLPCTTRLYLESGIYRGTGTESTKTSFTRTIEVEPVSETEEHVVSTVSWSFHGVTHSVVISDYLMPWQ